MNALDRKMARDLWRDKGPLLAVCLVMAAGIGTYIAMRSTLDSLAASRAKCYGDGRFADVFASMVRAPDRIAPRLEAIDGVAAVETRVVAGVTLDVRGTAEAVTGRIVSIPEFTRPKLNDLYLRLGRLPEPGHADEVVISEGFALAHEFQPGESLVAVLNGRRQELRITGVALSPEYIYSIKPGGILPDDRLFGVLWMRREALGRAFDMDGACNDIALALSHDASAGDVIAAVDRLLEDFGGSGAYLRADQQSHWYVENEINQLKNSARQLPMIFLAVAAFLLNIVLARTVARQRDQIAILKAFGYGNFAVGVHYSKMVFCVALTSALIGVFLGTWMGRGMTGVYTDFYRFPSLDYVFVPRHLLEAGSIGVIAALLGTWRSIRRAVRLPPAEAMRPEAPAEFKRTVLERLGLTRWLGSSSRIILRSMERQPLRAALTVAGIAGGGALIVVGFSFQDAMDFLMKVQFERSQRDDLTLQLTQPRDVRAMSELAHYPGVDRVEAVRAVATRLRAGPRHRRIGLTGLSQGATLECLLDRDLKTVAPAPEGLILTTTLADLLDVGCGDLVQVEVLEGGRPKHAVPVSRVVESFVGSGAYMELRALNRLLGEGEVMTAARMLVDEEELPRLYAQLKETPGISGVGLRREAMQSFSDTTAESMNVMSLFLVGFAAVIACGVVYNSARGLLSERGREFASLRVLGFRRREISVMFLGELWLLTLMAVPVGIVAGHVMAAAIMVSMETELYRIPLHIKPATYGYAALTVVVAAVISGLVVRRRLDKLDLVEVLKTRE